MKTGRILSAAFLASLAVSVLAQQPAQPGPSKLRVPSAVMEGYLLTKIDPVYPPQARAYRIQGVVTFQATIDREGNVSELKTITGHPLLVEPAQDAARQWKYKPYTYNDEPVIVETIVKVEFHL